MKNILLFTNQAPIYRKALWEELLNSEKYTFQFFFGKNKSSGIKEIDFRYGTFMHKKDQLHELKNIYIKDGPLFWQRGVLLKCLLGQMHAAIILGDFWVISSWIAAIICRMRGKRVIYWTHGFYGNESFLKRNTRKLFYKLAHDYLLYEQRGKELMIELGFQEKKMHVIFNSLDYKQSLHYRKSAENLNKHEVYPFFLNPQLPTLIFVGRLTKSKKLNYLISSIQLLQKKKVIINLLMVGDGEEKVKLMKLVEETELIGRCHFFGPCYSEDELSKLISTADLCVSPGNIGLTAIHSLSYGTPVLTHSNFANQGPEVGTIIEGKNGIFFMENDIESMVEKIYSWVFENSLSKEEIIENCHKVIDKYYNPEYQVMVIENLLENKPPLI